MKDEITLDWYARYGSGIRAHMKGVGLFAIHHWGGRVQLVFEPAYNNLDLKPRKAWCANVRAAQRKAERWKREFATESKEVSGEE